MLKKIFSFILMAALTIPMLFTTTAFASTDVQSREDVEIVEAYRTVMTYAQENSIPLDMSFETFIQEYKDGHYANVDEYVAVYHDILEVPENAFATPYSGGGKNGTIILALLCLKKLIILNTSCFLLLKREMLFLSKRRFRCNWSYCNC